MKKPLMRHKIYPTAKLAIKEIWRHTEKNWGEKPADDYVRGLYDAITKIADKRMLWRPVPHEQAQGVFFTRHEHHYIFFRELSSGHLGIVSILHKKMDLPARLKNDLEQPS